MRHTTEEHRLPYPDTTDQRQSLRSGEQWPAHKARARGRKSRRRRKEAKA